MRSSLLDRLPRRWWPLALRWGFNWYPSYRAIGARVIEVSDDLRRIVVQLPYRRRTLNPAGAIFGGALYAAADPMYAMLLALNLPKGMVVWDKAARIRYRRPGRSDLFAEFVLSLEALHQVTQQLEEHGRSEPKFLVTWHDAAGEVHCEVEKTVFVATSEYMRHRGAQRKCL